MGSDKRREERYSLATEAIIEQHTGERIPATTVNISGGGALLVINESAALQLGEQVCCEIKLYEGKAPQCWGMGRVVRVEGSLVAIDFHSGATVFDSHSNSPAAHR